MGKQLIVKNCSSLFTHVSPPVDPSSYEGLIIGVTGNIFEQDVQHFVASGANEVLAKPVNKQNLQGMSSAPDALAVLLTVAPCAFIAQARDADPLCAHDILYGLTTNMYKHARNAFYGHTHAYIGSRAHLCT